MNPEQIYTQAAPSVVHLKSVDAEGSGVFIEGGKYVLTNLHVVVTGTPVSVAVSNADGTPGPTLSGAQLFRVHPTLDLALLKVDAGKYKPVPAKGTDGALAPKPGSACYALTSPAGIEGALTNTITQGIVSSPRRMIDGQEYIQFSAAVNPGSSGGALLDGEGRFIGLVTAKQGGGEGLAFAIPVGGMDWAGFVEPAKRSGNRERYEKAMGLAERLRFSGALGVIGNPSGALPESLAAAAVLSRQALAEFPADEAAFRSLIEIYYLAGRQDVCLALSKSAGGITKDMVFTVLEARSLSLLGDDKQAQELYRKVLEFENNTRSPRTAGALAEILLKQKEPQWAQVAYLTRWALVSLESNNTADRTHYQEVLANAAKHLPEAAMAALTLKSADFNTKEMRDFPDQPLMGPPGSAEMAKAFDSSFFKPLLASSAGALASPKPAVVETSKETRPQYFCTLPVKVDQFIPASGGRMGILVSTEGDRVDMFDIALGDSIRSTKFPAGTLAKKFVIGGLNHWALVDREQFKITQYPLTGDESPTVVEPGGKTIQWNAIGAVRSPYRDDVAWILYLQKNGDVTVVINNFSSARIHTPDAGALPGSELRRWAENPKQGFVTDAPGMTLAPVLGSNVFLRLEPSGLVAMPLQGRFSLFGVSFPYADAPAAEFLDHTGSHRWSAGNRLENGLRAGGDGRIGTPLATAPVHGRAEVVQLLKFGRHLSVMILDGKTGESRIPVQETLYEVPDNTQDFTLSGQRRFEIISHASSSRIAIFDRQENQLLSVLMPDWDNLSNTTSKFVLQRKQGAVVHIPFPIPEGAKVTYEDHPDHGFEIDRMKGEILLTDPGPQVKGPVMPLWVTLVSKEGLSSLYRFEVLRDPAAPAK